MSFTVDPRTNPNKWLSVYTLHLLDHVSKGDKESREVLELVIQNICLGLEPGFIEDVFGQWIDYWCDMTNKNNQNNCDLSEDLKGFEEVEE